MKERNGIKNMIVSNINRYLIITIQIQSNVISIILW